MSDDGKRPPTPRHVRSPASSSLSFLRHLADYASEAERRVRSQAIFDVTGWIEAGSRFWVGVLDDLATQFTTSGERSRAVCASEVPCHRFRLPLRTSRASVQLQLPVALHQDAGLDATADRLTLCAGGFSRLGQPASILPGKHFDLVPDSITRADRRIEIRFFRLPADGDHLLVPGMYYTGLWIVETERLGMLLELQVDPK